jgi:hypothetical protein
LALLTAAPAMAFEFDSTGGSTPGAGSNYVDPFDGIDSQLEGKDKTAEAPNGAKILQGLQLNISGGGRTSSSVNGGAMGWTNPQPGRLTN